MGKDTKRATSNNIAI